MCRAIILVALCLVAAVLPWTIVEGKGCWAGTTAEPCLYGTVLPSGPDMVIRYRITSAFTRVCCSAYRCRYPKNCGFERVGCGENVPFFTNPMPWEARNVEPIVRCFDTRGGGAYYDFDVSISVSD